MGYLSNAIILVLSIGTVLFLGGLSIIGINPLTQNNANYSLIDCNTLPQGTFGACSNSDPNSFTYNTQNITGQLLRPEEATQDPIGTLTTNIVNTITSAYNWVTTPFKLGYNLIVSTVGLPITALKMTGLPPAFIWSIGLLMSIMIGFWVSDWFKGGQA